MEDRPVTAKPTYEELEQRVKELEQTEFARKRDLDELRESEPRTLKKLDDRLPNGDPDATTLNLTDIIDIQAIQSMMDDFFNLTNIGIAIIDLHGKILVATGWQDICTQFHRKHPESCKSCLESDLELSNGIEPGTFRVYRCQNNMWDMATPITVGDKHVGNLYLGQFLFEAETPDLEVFRSQAQKYGFNEGEYLAALERVPRWSHETVDIVITFYTKLAQMISELSYSNIKIAQTLKERDKLLNSLRESEAFLKILINSIPIPIFYKDRDGKYLWFNKAFESFFGETKERLIGKSVFDIHPPELAEIYHAQDAELFNSGGLQRYDSQMKNVQGELRDIIFNKAVYTNNQGVVTGLIGAITDITDRKIAEQEHEKLSAQLLQAQKMESIGRLAGGVAHDFNNKLGVILGFVQMILTDMEPENPIYEDLEEVQNAAKGAGDLTRQLLAFARKQTIAPRELDVNETLEGMFKMLGRLIGEDIDLAYHPHTNLWSVKMDPVQIDQILANLAVNARDAIGGVGKITIETKNAVLDDAYCAEHMGSVPGEFVMLTVSDNGCGMDKTTVDQIFEPFFSTKEVGKGTGLGLSTVYGIVKQNNGFISVYSEPNEGTTFKIYMPRYQGGPSLKTLTGSEEVPKGDGETILLVEDDAGILRMARMMLERLGYAVLTANSPHEAMEIAGEHSGRIHLLMTDVVMPQMNGKDLAEQVMKIRPETKTLFMSGYTANAIAHQGILDEGVNFIEKPFMSDSLARKVREVLDGVRS
jgi:PAS domain S-box-containing protein